MAGMNKIIHDKLNARYREWLLIGHFPKVEYKEVKAGDSLNYSMKSYSMMEYGFVWARIAKVADLKLKAQGIAEGVFVSNRKNRNSEFLKTVETLASSLTVEEIGADETGERFRTMFD